MAASASSLSPCPERKTGRIPGLDGLRAISIALVILGHSMYSPHSFPFRLAFIHPSLGVRAFFVISGFLITTLLMEEEARKGKISLGAFYLRRTLRIFPAFYFFAGVLFLLTCFGLISITPTVWLHIVTYTVNFTRPTWYSGHLWSLSVEEQFYLIWPPVLYFLRKRALVMCVAVLSILMGPAVRALGIIPPDLGYAFPFVCGPIALGCLLALNFDAVRAAYRRWPGIFRGSVFAAVLLFVLILDTWSVGDSNAVLKIVRDAALTGLIARCVLVRSGVVARILNSPPARYIGGLSYSLYLWQQLFFNPYGGQLLNRFPFNLAGAAAAALISYYLIEKPFLALRHKLL